MVLFQRLSGESPTFQQSQVYLSFVEREQFSKTCFSYAMTMSKTPLNGNLPKSLKYIVKNGLFVFHPLQYPVVGAVIHFEFNGYQIV